jgi:CheY-like chemotaxis protein
MTTGKRALIVDDSRSARVILSRMLEQHGLTTDTAESAEQALEYLQRTRPDVIFMDHLMPGMDGFQAVQAIKADPLTATIPLMMYTSQEGELYVSQARALGAVGVLPKTVRPVDVSRVLYQLHLLPDRRTQRTTLFPGPAAAAARAAEGGHDTEPAIAAALAAGAPESPAEGSDFQQAASVGPHAHPMAFTPELASELQASLRQSMQQLVKDQLGEQRRFLLATFEAFARRMAGELKEGIARIPAPPSPDLLAPAPPQRQWWPVGLTALLAAVPAVVLGFIAWQAASTNQALTRDLTDAKATAARARADAIAAATAASAAATLASTAPASSSSGSVATEFVPYGETPLAGNRLDRLRSLASSLEGQQFHGRIRVESFVGDFCLTGNSSDDFKVADPSLAAAKCDLVGNPFDDSLSPAQRQSVDFANFVATLQRRNNGAIQIEIVNAGRTKPVAYPDQGEKLSAGTWNTIAAQNNRVEFHVLPGA